MENRVIYSSWSIGFMRYPSGISCTEQLWRYEFPHRTYPQSNGVWSAKTICAGPNAKFLAGGDGLAGPSPPRILNQLASIN